ncbi:hypothetical protein LSM04_008688 [Trypanosoma melophagium]|uniref:uncharacterized protein n=1 Tax=Trypanosoma melophagium TaxID=715481 RepID=UPI00351A6928|nr:hypothetical protein LSM04_008395 [Trypanosoma melophagium]KAH9598453.1 hypothetical protein LSM04_008688 [Trypanosoma melophagium]
MSNNIFQQEGQKGAAELWEDKREPSQTLFPKSPAMPFSFGWRVKFLIELAIIIIFCREVALIPEHCTRANCPPLVIFPVSTGRECRMENAIFKERGPKGDDPSHQEALWR